jgi:thioredoxin-like negative regulator of GroEL
MDGGREAKHHKHHNKTAKTSHSKKPIVLLLHASWCGHCQHLMPEWERMENEIHSPTDPLHGKVEIVKIESEEMDTKLPKYKAMTHKKNIPMEGYPTIALIHGGNVVTYGGERSAENIKNWIKDGGKTQDATMFGGKKKQNKKSSRRKRSRRSGCKSCKSGSLLSFFK